MTSLEKHTSECLIILYLVNLTHVDTLASAAKVPVPGMHASQ